MAKCVVCKKKILYNRYKTINGKVYCPNCSPPTEKEKHITKKLANVVKTEKLNFEEFKEAMKKPGTIVEEKKSRKKCSKKE